MNASEGELLRNQLAECTAKAMLDYMREQFPNAPWSEDVVNMEAHERAADEILARFDVRLRVPQANEDWDVSIVGRVVAGDFERACDHLMLALVELGGTDPGISGNLSTGEVEIDWLWACAARRKRRRPRRQAMNRRMLVSFDAVDAGYPETTPETVIKLLELRGVHARVREIGPEPQRHLVARLLTRLRLAERAGE